MQAFDWSVFCDGGGRADDVIKGDGELLYTPLIRNLSHVIVAGDNNYAKLHDRRRFAILNIPLDVSSDTL
jgi:hypothetical protein